MNYFLKTMKGHKLGDSRGIGLALEALNLDNLSKQTKDVKGREYATKLINTFDRIEYIDVSKIPLNPKHPIWYYRVENIKVNDKIHSVEIAISKNKDNNWRFTQGTLDSLQYYEIYLKNKNVVANVAKDNSFKERLKRKLPAWAFKENFVILNIQWLALLAIILFSYIIDRIVRLYIAVKLVNYLARRGVVFTDKEQKKFTTPIGFLSFAIVLNWLIKYIELPEKILSYFLKGCEIAIAVSVILVLVKILDIVCLFLEEKAKQTENKFDDILVPLIRKTARFFIYSFGIIFIGDALDINMKNILAGMGIGGIAFALAAKDTVSNLFGSFTVLVDRPFSIGDWVVINDKIEGTVVEVGLRSTRIKTFYDSIITVPNGNLTSAHIDNLGQRKYRRYTTKLTIDYGTPADKVENFCEAVRQVILKHPYTRKDYFHVYFNDLGASALEILLYVFWEVPDWSCELNERQNLLLDIMRVADEMGINFAYPTQTLHVVNSNEPQHENLPRDFQQAQNLVQSLDTKREMLHGHRSDSQNCK
jgi:MscS family membrane protein